MKLVFNPNLSHQKEAIKSVTDLFIGQSMASINSISNYCDLTDEQLLRNTQEVQKRNRLEKSKELIGRNFSVEMETGTGKTYVYLKTIYELNKLYGFKKFIIVVPSIAIREGVLKNLQITHAHFQEDYEKVPIHFRIYDSGKVSDLRDFAQNNHIEILVLGIDSFTKDTNIINIARDQTGGIEPIKLIQSVCPIIIIDEPQNMETEKRKNAIRSLNGFCTLRYSATHKHRYHLVYSLNPVQAYNSNLVKQIEVVDSIESENAFNEPFITVHRVESRKNRITATAFIDADMNGDIKKKKVILKLNSNLYKESGNREIYRGYQVSEIDVKEQRITFSNGKTVEKGQDLGTVSDHVRRQQIKNTIIAHLKKEKELKIQNQKIKVLSLFFIDKVANYRCYESQGSSSKGKYARWFEEIYTDLLKKENRWTNDFEINNIHNGYFSKDNKGALKDTKGDSKMDRDTYFLIMKHKEKLLNPNNPLRFIFSHSTLREGWDNPNVFQICTLNETSSEIKKRQEIGRGLRLCVNHNGEQIRDLKINRLTVIPNESYDNFAKALQKEIEDDCGVSFAGRIKKSRDWKQIRYRKGFVLDKHFKEIWDRIKQKTIYRVNYQTEDLIHQSVENLIRMDEIQRPQIVSRKKRIVMDETSGVGEQLIHVNSEPVDIKLMRIPNIVEEIEKKTNIKKMTIKMILKNSNRYEEAKNNPQLFINEVSEVINHTLEGLLIDGIKYQKIEGQEYEMSVFKIDELYAYRNDNDFDIRNPDKTIYDSWIPLDSNVENKFAKDCETSEQVKFYFKLPNGFKIPTPIGNYNPDWALIFENDNKIYFVAETKETSPGQVNESSLRPEEQQKIKYGRAHFKEFEDVVYQVTPNLETLSLNTPKKHHE